MAGNKYNVIQKVKIINDFNSGLSQQELSKKYSIHKSTISRIIKKYHCGENLETFHKGGRKRKLTQRQERLIIRKIKQNPRISAKEILNELQLNVSLATVKRRAKENGYKAYKPAKKPHLSKKNIKARLDFAKEHKEWTLQKWRTVLFSDESKFNLRGSDGGMNVRRPKGERYNPKYTNKTVKFGGGNIMVWGCFSAQDVGPITKIKGTMTGDTYKSILQNIMLPYAEENMPISWVFQHDNDPKHTSRVVKNWLEGNNIKVLKWPAQSPDLNPIENLWQIVKSKVGKQIFKKKSKLYRCIKKEWKKIKRTQIMKLIESMPKKCAQVIKNKGHPIKY